MVGEAAISLQVHSSVKEDQLFGVQGSMLQRETNLRASSVSLFDVSL